MNLSLLTYHNEIIEEEDFSLVRRLFLGLVDISHLKQSTAAHQSSVRDREDLQREGQAFKASLALRGFTVIEEIEAERDTFPSEELGREC